MGHVFTEVDGDSPLMVPPIFFGVGAVFLCTFCVYFVDVRDSPGYPHREIGRSS